MKKMLCLNLIISCIASAYGSQKLQNEFVYLSKISPSIQQDIRYGTSNNFIGKPLPGYENPVCILTKPTAYSLLKIQKELNKNGFGLKIFDGYRPQMTVDELTKWSRDIQDQKMKNAYYQNVKKADFLKLG